MRLALHQIGKRYGRGHWALRGIDLEVGPGVCGLLGPNGAGKTTLMNILATLTTPTEGEAMRNGESVRRHPQALRRMLGYLPEDFGVYPNLTAVEFLHYLAAAKGIAKSTSRRRIEALLNLVNLTYARHRRLETFSGGMRQRVGIAQALLNDPQLLIVDEPTAGLDPEERVRFRNLIAELSAERIVILSTHIVSDIEMAATGIAFLKGGQLLGYHMPEQWLRTVQGRVWRWIVLSERLAEVQATYIVGSAVRRSDGVHLRVVNDTPPGPSAELLEPTLEDAYIGTVGGRA
jgi:ABC-type multidrug transport system ATPase subunit